MLENVPRAKEASAVCSLLRKLRELIEGRRDVQVDEEDRSGQQATGLGGVALIEDLAACRQCEVSVRFTGVPAQSEAEDLIQRVAGGRNLVPLRWLEEQIAEALYKAELRRGGWVLDLGVWGPSGFRQEAARILGSMRSEFGFLAE